MFGKKKENAIPVQHYEGLKDFAQDFPCKIEIKDSNFEIRRLKPETTVTLPLDRIKSFSAMEEPRFMLKYHGDKAKTNKLLSGKKYYLVVDYVAQDGSEKMLAFWGTASEYSKFIELQNMTLGSAETSYCL